ncbi:hypothetical protein OF829_13065 [Sphingomonas sp. LB-2]|uniref:hypothetical protein n=1 Tax=Sphingomonas caeni TaxID=2984949 RepID=UPI002230C63F|nr:hypothetical protein [Sphingomonas caeni]MCW3848170.1 hypothetical protein [Sphingomonas caeni]
MKKIAASALLATALLAPQASMAQGGDADPRPPLAVVDANGVEVFDGGVRLQIPLISYGSSARPLGVSLSLASPNGSTSAPLDWPMASVLGFAFKEGLSTNYFAVNLYTVHGTVYRVQMPGGNGEYKAIAGGRNYQSDGSYYMTYFGQNPATYMNFSDPSRDGVYTMDGTRGVFSSGSNTFDRFEFPDGEVWKLYYDQFARLKFIVSNRGYGLQYSYVRNTAVSGGSTDPNFGSLYAPTRITFYNRSSVYCNEAALVDCASVTALPTAVTFTYDDTNRALTINRPGDTQGYRIVFGAAGIVTTGRVGSTGSEKHYSYGYDSDTGQVQVVTQVTDIHGTWNYLTTLDPDQGGGVGPTGSHGVREDPDGHQIVMSGSFIDDSIRGEMDENYNSFGYGWARGELVAETRPDGSGLDYEVDARGNITKRKIKPASGSGQPVLETQTTYASECLNPRICNRPLTITDRNNNTTSFTYNSVHGGVLTETGPAVGGIQPVKRYSYIQRYAWVKNSAGAYVQEATPIWVVSEMRFCRTTATVSGACGGGTSDEVVTAYDYGPDSGPNNLLLRGVAVTADGQTLRTCYGYDVNGNKIWETAARAGLTSCY